MAWYLNGAWEGVAFDQLGHILADLYNACMERSNLLNGTATPYRAATYYDGKTRGQINTEITSLRGTIRQLFGFGSDVSTSVQKNGGSTLQAGLFCQGELDRTLIVSVPQLLGLGSYGASWVAIGDNVLNTNIYLQMREAIQKAQHPVYIFGRSAGASNRRLHYESPKPSYAILWDNTVSETPTTPDDNVLELSLYETTGPTGNGIIVDSCVITLKTEYIRGEHLESRVAISVTHYAVWEWLAAPTFRMTIGGDTYDIQPSEVYDPYTPPGEISITETSEGGGDSDWPTDGTDIAASLSIIGGIPSDSPFGNTLGAQSGGNCKFLPVYGAWFLTDPYGGPPYYFESEYVSSSLIEKYCRAYTKWRNGTELVGYPS